MMLLENVVTHFQITALAEADIEKRKQLFRDVSREEPAAVAVSWGTAYHRSGHVSDGLYIGFYADEELAKIPSSYVARIGRNTVVFFIVKRDYPRFANKVLDWREDRGLYLRDPGP